MISITSVSENKTSNAKESRELQTIKQYNTTDRRNSKPL
jgi:hypothetical protein